LSLGREPALCCVTLDTGVADETTLCRLVVTALGTATAAAAGLNALSAFVTFQPASAAASAAVYHHHHHHHHTAKHSSDMIL